jgi:hypothetical protein
MLSGLSP